MVGLSHMFRDALTGRHGGGLAHFGGFGGPAGGGHCQGFGGPPNPFAGIGFGGHGHDAQSHHCHGPGGCNCCG